MRYALGRRLDWLKPHCARCGLKRSGWRLPVAMPGPAGPICSGPARYEWMLPAAARTVVARTVVARTPGAVVPDVRATRAGQDLARQDLARLDLPPVSLASEWQPSARSAHVLPAHVVRRRPVRARRKDARVAAARCGVLVAPPAARRCAGRPRERQVPRAAQEPPAVQPPGAALVPDVRLAARRAALLSLKWPPCRRQGQEALRCACLIAT